MKYFGIKHPNTGKVWWIFTNELDAWLAFLLYPSPNPYPDSVEETIKGFEELGYKCVELSFSEVVACAEERRKTYK